LRPRVSKLAAPMNDAEGLKVIPIDGTLARKDRE
jgi:hypothetical protein